MTASTVAPTKYYCHNSAKGSTDLQEIDIWLPRDYIGGLCTAMKIRAAGSKNNTSYSSAKE